jgi:hypothetical protein
MTVSFLEDNKQGKLTDRHSGRNTEKQNDKKTGRWKDRSAGREMNRQKEDIPLSNFFFISKVFINCSLKLKKRFNTATFAFSRNQNKFRIKKLTNRILNNLIFLNKFLRVIYTILKQYVGFLYNQ